MLPSQSGSDRAAADPFLLSISDSSQVGEARRAASALVHRLGFDQTQSGKTALIVTEAASNLVKHASGGQLLLIPVEQDEINGLEILALDRGPGMADLERCFRDGFSTAGSPGTGLGAIGRLADFLDVHSGVPTGTALLARLWARSPGDEAQRHRSALEFGAVNLPKAGEDVCGDAWAVHQERGRILLLVADGLGHGPIAAEASRAAVRIFRGHAQLDPAALVRTMHGALASTRGAAVAVAEIDLSARQLRFAGVGNIAGTIFAGGASHSTVSHNGTVGHACHKVQEFAYDFPHEALLILHSDGLATHWRLDRYPGLADRHPSLIAGLLYRDWQRGRDDVTVLVVRPGQEAS